MKRTTRIVLSMVKGLSLDSFFAGLPSFFRIFKKFVPHPDFYKPGDEIVVKRNRAMFCLNRSDWMQWHIYANLEDNSWKYAMKLLQKVNEGKLVIFDIGSNVGAFCFKLAKNLARSGRNDFVIHAFDPNPYIKERFKANLKMNSSLQNEVTFHSFAVSDSCGNAFFDFTPQNSGTGSIRNAGFNVEVTSIDAFCELSSPDKLDFIKIDVEGFEPFVFDGGKKTIEKHRPAIYAEISPALYKEKGRSAQEIFNYLHNMNYDLYLDKGSQPVLIDMHNTETLLKEYQFNILAIPN